MVRPGEIINNPYEKQLTPRELLEVSDDFLAAFNVTVSPFTEAGMFLEELGRLRPEYKARFELEKSTQEFNAADEIIRRTAEAYGMMDEQTRLRGDFDVLIILGGARRSNLDRANYALEAFKARDINFGQMVIAGSARPLVPGEAEVAADYAPGAQTEFDLCVGAAATVAKENPGMSVSVQLTPKKENGGLPGTPQVIEAVLTDLDQRGLLNAEQSRVGAVTTQIYQPWTKFDLERVARRYGIVDTMTAGNPSDPEIVAKRTTATYLAEIVRALEAATLAIHEGA
jgi:hypothetical protein